MTNQITTLDMGKKFKKTPAGEIPVEWECVKFRDLISLEYGESLPEYKRMPGQFPVYGSNGIVGYHAQALKKGPGIIIGRKGTVGAVTWSEGDYWPIDTTYYIAEDQVKADLRWLYYLLKYLDLGLLNTATGVPGLNREHAYDLNIPMPLQAEQKKIAEILTAVDESIEKARAVIEKTKELKKALIQTLLTCGIGHKKFKKTPAGEIPVEWEISTFGDSFDFLRTANNSRSDLDPTEKVGYVHYGDIHTRWRTKLRCDREELGRIDPSKVEKIPSLRDGDIVMADASEDYDGMGVAVEVSNVGDQRIVAGLHTLLLRDKGNMFANGFRGYIQYIPMVHQRLIEIATGVSVYGLSKGRLVGVPIPRPPLEEQKKIAEILTAVDEKIEKEENARKIMEGLKKGLMQALLTGRIRVPI